MNPNNDMDQADGLGTVKIPTFEDEREISQAIARLTQVLSLQLRFPEIRGFTDGQLHDLRWARNRIDKILNRNTEENV